MTSAVTASAASPPIHDNRPESKLNSKPNANVSAAVTPKTMNSMNLAISHENATRMLEASRSLNAALDKIQGESPPSTHDGSNGDMPHLIEAARSSEDALLKTFVGRMTRDVDGGELSMAEMRTCLLIFLDIDSGKSSKLLNAFQELRSDDGGNESQGADECVGQELKLDRNGIMKLFRCFLLSISTCIHYDDSHSIAPPKNLETKLSKHDPGASGPKVSPECTSSNTWTLSTHTKKNIQEISNYATDKVMHHVAETSNKNSEFSMETPVKSNDEVNFSAFGEWYNSGGYLVVPWLELLDLAKWHYAGRAAEKAAAAEKAIEKHQAKSQAQSAQTDRNFGMEPIMENFTAGHPSSPHPHLNPSAQFDLPPAQPPSEPLATFEFAGKKDLSLCITDENLKMFQALVEKTGLCERSPSQICKTLFSHAKQGSGPYRGIPVIHREVLPAVIRSLLPHPESSTLTQKDVDSFSAFFTILYLSNAKSLNKDAFPYDLDQVSVKELAVGFSFLCSGNKSQKLDETFKIMADEGFDYMVHHQLVRFIRAYLRMLVGVSLLSSSAKVNHQHTHALRGSNKNSEKVFSLCNSADVGAKWIVDNFMRSHKSKNKPDRASKITFEDFAFWYTEGGFKTAPWLEFLDHKKFVGLLKSHEQRKADLQRSVPAQGALLSPSAPPMNPPTSSGKVRSFDEFVAGSPSPRQRNKTPRSVHAKQQPYPERKDVLSTFPLSDGRSLIVLREDAAYVRAVVEQFGLIQHTPGAVWSKLYNHAEKQTPKPLPPHKAHIHKSGSGKCRDVNQKIFVDGVLKSVPAKCKRKRSPLPLAPTPKDTLKFFFLSFDIKELDRVAVNQLMGGLTLLCGGSKTSKLNFAFSLFDARSDGHRSRSQSDDTASLCGKEVFYFLRSILIVLFSCCRQSLDLTAGPVGSYIADAANMVTNDIMKYQWRARKVERINFDEFGEWYNEGGFEIAPWLELLDLNKWAFLDKEKAAKMISKAKPMKGGLKARLQDTTNKQHPVTSKSPPALKGLDTDFFSPEKCPPPPADEDFDPEDDEFFGADIGGMEEIDSFDVDFFDQTLSKEGNTLPDISISEPLSNDPLPEQSSLFQHEPMPLTFSLCTNSSDHYTVSVSPRRVSLLKGLIMEAGMHEVNIATLCEKILEASQGSTISKEQFEQAINLILFSQQKKKMDKKRKKTFIRLLLSIFDEFDTKNMAKVDAAELACGLTILCGGSKSDKLEYAFEVLDKMKQGMATRFQMVRYLHSFLTVLLHISSCEIGDESAEYILYAGTSANKMKIDKRLIGWVSSWATEEVFKSTPLTKNGTSGAECINFDNFADWYTKGGYKNIAWLELLDLKKWILSIP